MLSIKSIVVILFVVLIGLIIFLLLNPEIAKKYIVDHYLQNGGFNLLDTALYGLGLVVGVYVVYKLLEKLKTGIDWHFVLAILPFIFWAGVTRAIRDFIYVGVSRPADFFTSFTSNYNTVYSATFNHVNPHLPIPFISELYSSMVTWFVTPGSYLITFVLALVVFLVSYGIQKAVKISYWKPMFVMGLAILVGAVLNLPVKSFVPLTYTLSATLIGTFVFLVIAYLSQHSKGIFTKLKTTTTYANVLILGAHYLDAATTTYAITVHGFTEQHPVPRFFFENFGGIGGGAFFFLLKTIVVLAVLHVFDQNIKDSRLRNFLKVVVLILGLAPGLRGTSTMLLQ